MPGQRNLQNIRNKYCYSWDVFHGWSWWCLIGEEWRPTAQLLSQRNLFIYSPTPNLIPPPLPSHPLCYLGPSSTHLALTLPPLPTQPTLPYLFTPPNSLPHFCCRTLLTLSPHLSNLPFPYAPRISYLPLPLSFPSLSWPSSPTPFIIIQQPLHTPLTFKNNQVTCQFLP